MPKTFGLFEIALMLMLLVPNAQTRQTHTPSSDLIRFVGFQIVPTLPRFVLFEENMFRTDVSDVW